MHSISTRKSKQTGMDWALSEYTSGEPKLSRQDWNLGILLLSLLSSFSVVLLLLIVFLNGSLNTCANCPPSHPRNRRCKERIPFKKKRDVDVLVTHKSRGGHFVVLLVSLNCSSNHPTVASIGATLQQLREGHNVYPPWPREFWGHWGFFGSLVIMRRLAVGKRERPGHTRPSISCYRAVPI